MKKKVLILTASYGSGHNAAAKGSKIAFDELYPNEIETEILDLVKLGNPAAVAFYRTFYEKSMQWSPEFWNGLFWFSTSHEGAVRFFDKFSLASYGAMPKILAEKKPDFFLSVHPYWTPYVIEHNKVTGRQIEHVQVITDSITIHCSWMLYPVDKYIVPNEETKEAMAKAGTKPEIMFPLGFPVNPHIGKPLDRNNFLTELGLRTDIPTILIIFGLGKVNNLRTVFDYLTHKTGTEFQVIAITAKRTELFEEFSQKSYTVPTKIIGWTDKMHDFLRASDILISKAGGAIIMESLAAGKPILNPEYSPGQEQGNGQLLQKYNAGIMESNIGKMIAFIDDVLTHKEKLKALQDGAKKLGNPDAAYSIAKFVYQEIMK